MKNIVKFVFALAAFVPVLAACDKLMESKDTIDAKYAQSVPENVTVKVDDVTITEYTNFNITLSVSDTVKVIDFGVLFSAKSDMSDCKYIATGYVGAKKRFFSETVTVGGLAEDTEYYLQPYAYTAGGALYGEKKTVKTLKAPKFEDEYLFGTYTALDIDISSGQPDGGEYEVVIAPSPNGWNKMLISNIWGGGKTIEATVDFETKTFVTNPGSVVYVHSSYGNVYARGFDIKDGKVVYYDNGLEQAITYGEYDDKGNISFGYWAAYVSAGYFGYYLTQLVKAE